MQRVKQRLFLISIGLLSVAQAYAQQRPVARPSDPGVVQQRQMEEERRRREEFREQQPAVTEPLHYDPLPVQAPSPSEQDAVRFLVKEIRFTPSEILSAEELATLAAAYQGKEVSLSDLKRLTAEINQLYQRKGVVTAQAILPPQDITSGTVQIRLVEGRLGTMNIKGNDTTRRSYIEYFLGAEPGTVMDVGSLEHSLIRFNRTNDIQLQADLKAGSQFGTTDLELQVNEPERHVLRVTADNLGSVGTGVNRGGVSYFNRSLFGFRDDLALSYTGANGQESQAYSYGVPITPWGGRLTAGYYRDHTWVKNGSLKSLNLSGLSTARTLTLRQPTYVDSNKQLDLVLGGKKRTTTNWIETVHLQELDTRDASVGFEGSWFDQKNDWFLSYIRAFGALDGDTRDDFTHDYVIDRGTLRYSHDFGGGYALRTVFSWQSSSSVKLPSSEQFFIGGDGSVRGYPVGIYAGDTGQFVSAEFHHPMFEAGSNSLGVAASGFLFIDYGRVKPFRPPDTLYREHDTLTGAGWGVLANMGKRAYGRLTFGYGLEKVPNQPIPRPYEINFQLVLDLL